MRSKRANGGRVLDVQGERLHPGVGGGGLVEGLFAAAGDDDLVAESVEGLSQPAANAGASAGDENGVVG